MIEWHKLTQKQRDLCRQAQREDREHIAGWLEEYSRLRLVCSPGESLRLAAGTIRRGGHTHISQEQTGCLCRTHGCHDLGQPCPVHGDQRAGLG